LEMALKGQEEVEKLVKDTVIQGCALPQEWLKLSRQWLQSWEEIGGAATGVSNPILTQSRQYMESACAGAEPLLKASEEAFRTGFSVYERFSWSLMERRKSDAQTALFCAMGKWIADGVPQPGGVFREFVKGCYQENLLIQNRMKLGRRRVDLKKIRCPVLNIFAEGDHIIPPQSSRAFNTAISSPDKTLLPFPAGGHVGMTVGAQAGVALWPRVVGWLAERSG
jgi:pimeloyl-ACP methyl ester carboxylesterase